MILMILHSSSALCMYLHVVDFRCLCYVDFAWSIVPCRLASLCVGVWCSMCYVRTVVASTFGM